MSSTILNSQKSGLVNVNSLIRLLLSDFYIQKTFVASASEKKESVAAHILDQAKEGSFEVDPFIRVSTSTNEMTQVLEAGNSLEVVFNDDMLSRKSGGRNANGALRIKGQNKVIQSKGVFIQIYTINTIMKRIKNQLFSHINITAFFMPFVTRIVKAKYYEKNRLRFQCISLCFSEGFPLIRVQVKEINKNETAFVRPLKA